VSANAYLFSRAADDRALVPNTPVAGELRSGEVHVYKINLSAGTYLRLLITPLDINVQPQLFAPGGSEDIGVSFVPTEKGTRSVSLIAESSGSHRLEIRLAEESATAGRYEVKIEELRPATEQDRGRVAAEKAEGEGTTLLNRVNTSEQVRQGIAKYEEALALWRKIEERKGEMRVLNLLNIQLRKIGEPQTALEYTRQAIQIAGALGDRYQEANSLISLGVLYRSSGENQKALDTFHHARQLFKDLSARYGEAIAVYHIGATLRRIGEQQEALRYVEEAVAVFDSLGDRRGQCNALNSLGQIYLALGDKQKAIEFHSRALEIARNRKSLDIEAYSLGNLGNAYGDLGDKQKALDFYEQAVRLAGVIGDHLGEADGLKLIGDIAFSLGDHQKALGYFDKALQLYRSIWEREREAIALHALTLVNRALGNLEQARNQVEQSLEIRESLRASLISQRLRESFFTSAQNSFSLYIDVLMQLHKTNPANGQAAAALQASERSRGRSLLELLAESGADIRHGVPPNVLDLERSLRQQISDKAAARTTLLNGKSTQHQTAFFDKEISELTSRHREVEVQIRKSSPRYAALTQPQPLSAIEIQQQLDDNTVLIEFNLGEKRSWLWAVTPLSIDSYQLASGREIEAVARRVYELLTARQLRKGESADQYERRVDDAEVQFQTESAKLSQMLFGQISTKLQQEWKGKRLAIVACGALEYIPFGALPMVSVGIQAKTGSPRSALPNPQPPEPLIKQHEIVNLPSASVLATIRSETAGRRVADKTLAVIADPVFEANDFRVLNALKKGTSTSITAGLRSSSDDQTSSAAPTSARSDSELARSLRSFDLINERGGFRRLPFSREEATEIAAMAPSNSSLKATDFHASRILATTGELSHYRIVHFATHGLLNSERPELSGLVLSLVDETGKPQDGFLRMQEIYNLQIPADLVVLSACQTALGKEIKGEGLVGLTRGFMYAGAKRVVASLWQVDDLATAELMKRFYRGMLKDGLRPAQALRVAQLEVMNQKRWSSPFFWAPFFIQGEWR
jgi:CHAT domain-containing protein